MSVHDAATSGDELAALEALRDRIARDVDECQSDRDVASLSARLMETLKRISELRSKAPAAVSPVDEIASRRARRKPLKNGVTREA